MPDIKLDTQNDWEEWIMVIRALAEGADIWEYLDPEGSTALVAPVQPTPTTVGAVDYATLTPNQLFQLNTELAQFTRAQRKFDRQELEIKKFRTEIINRLGRQNLIYATDAKDTPEILLKLSQRFKPTADWRRREILSRYTKLRDTPPRKIEIDTWLTLWERVYIDAKKAGLPDVEGTRPIEDFITVSGAIIPGFADYWRNRILEGLPDDLTFFSFIQKFREFRAQTVSFPLLSHGAFAATLQGRDRDWKTDLPPCLCGENHRFSACPYLCPVIRQEGWTPDLQIQAYIERILSENEKIREAVEKAREYADRTRGSKKIAPPDTPSVF